MSFRHVLLSGDILFGPVRALRQTDHQIWLGLETGVWNLTGNTDGFQFPVSSFKKKDIA